ncbi:FliM/FliN family flagellar motor C-terminal domain-containing protein [Variovorax sp. CAN2819]|jgi:flagellar motor switch protein FliN/FliY|uniref:FliM/FliN family flagellar motor C-terminal domain-containing protein n=1 Tax=Variovorax sp. CAN15 TaxID=3046727 RepID=UPI00264750B5|nr:FliM/FliN family flagellar motor C-terminal domain-containing protein [Variovorax sp. CAN15]MDN6886185.1 FliM/FliN family flagellar motor C-terminal domain-containing protein [Variovorax sp. CAN15]
MTQALEGIVTDNRIGAANTTTEGRGETRTRAAAGGMPTAQIIALPDLHPGSEGNPGEAPILKEWNPLHQIKAKLQVCVGEATISVGELLGAKENQVLRLDRSFDQPVDLTIEGKVVARGQLVAVDGHFAVRITELPVALGLTPGS